MSIVLSTDAYKIIRDHAKETYPHECCGFLYGTDGNERTIAKAAKVDNSKEGDQRRRFEISATDYMKAEQYALENGTTLLGVYHSHPEHPAVPSEHDLKQALPFFSYIIISVMKSEPADMRSWQLNEKALFEEENILNEKIPILK
jgi:proteasome lid subunit RPN8/RPN11